MFWYLFKISFLSLFIVILIHHIIIYLKNNLTTPKIIDCVDKPKKEYENIKQILKDIKEESKKQEEEVIDLDIMREELTSHIHNIQ
jgi:ferritin